MYGIKPELFTFFPFKKDKLPHLYENFLLLLYDLIDLDNFIIKKNYVTYHYMLCDWF